MDAGLLFIITLNLFILYQRITFRNLTDNTSSQYLIKRWKQFVRAGKENYRQGELGLRIVKH
jgi:hypothetical protein